MDPELQQLICDHMDTCSVCTKDTVDADGYAELGEYCEVATDIIADFYRRQGDR